MGSITESVVGTAPLQILLHRGLGDIQAPKRGSGLWGEGWGLRIQGLIDQKNPWLPSLTAFH